MCGAFLEARGLAKVALKTRPRAAHVLPKAGLFSTNPLRLVECQLVLRFRRKRAHVHLEGGESGPLRLRENAAKRNRRQALDNKGNRETTDSAPSIISEA